MEAPWNNWLSDTEMNDSSSILGQWEIASSTNNHQDKPPVVAPPAAVTAATGGGKGSAGGSFCRSLSTESRTCSYAGYFRNMGYVGDNLSPSAAFVSPSNKTTTTTTQEMIGWKFLQDHGGGGPSSPSSLLHSTHRKPAAAKPKEETGLFSPRNYSETIKQQETTTAFNLQRPTLSQAQEHIIAERNRREKLNQKFIALSAIIPGLKKADKASVLEDAVRYVKELKAKVKALEDRSVERTVESVVLVKKSQLRLPAEEDSDAGAAGTSSSDESFEDDGTKPWKKKPFPEIEAKVSGKTVLVRIHCENRKGVLVKILSEIESLNLAITNTNVMPFLGSSINMTITAQIEEEFSMTAKDLVRKMKSALNFK